MKKSKQQIIKINKIKIKIKRLPNECIRDIIKWLPLNQRLFLKQISKTWYVIVNSIPISLFFILFYFILIISYFNYLIIISNFNKIK